MNFTREPIIETVITPREGCKLIVRSSKGTVQEEYLVDAVEVVSFGRSLFFRSLERPKSFLVPVSDYEILELKETRAVLKNASPERSIKIGGGREAAPFRSKETTAEETPSEQQSSRPPIEGRNKRDRRRRGRRGRDRQEPSFSHSTDEPAPPIEEEASLEPAALTEETKAPSFISKLFPPPPTLIKESLGRYKPPEPSSDDEDLFPQEDLPSPEEGPETTEEE